MSKTISSKTRKIKWIRSASARIGVAKTKAMKIPKSKPKAKSAASKKVVWRDARTGKFVLARTSDGVLILKPKGNPTHFTTSELRDAISAVRAARKG
jgi:hypothetical protein